MRRAAPLALAALAACASAAEPARVGVAGREVAVWRPAGAVPAAGSPLILFSHGFRGCSTQSTFLMEALARAGYLVLAPDHEDARCGAARGKGRLFVRPEEPFRDPEWWSDAVYRDRAGDLRSLLDAATREGSFEGAPVDPRRIGVAGHSLGGYTALGLAGAWPSWRDPRVRAVLALSPYSAPFLDHGDLGGIRVPVMYQGGTRDLGVTPAVRREDGAYERSSSPKYYVELDGAGHFAWTRLDSRYHEVVSGYAVAFFDRHLRGARAPDRLASLTRPPLPALVSEVRAEPD